jgi:antitoxin component YwqK of YwqJK toxin-antitoxin module
MNRLIQVVITTIIITLSFNSFAEAKKTYYESGALEYVVLFNNSKPEGLLKSYSESGLLIKRENYKNGKLVGEWTRE